MLNLYQLFVYSFIYLTNIDLNSVHMIFVTYFRHFESVHNIFRPSGKYLKGFSSHDAGKTYAPEFLSNYEIEPSLKRKRRDSNANLDSAKRQYGASQSNDELEANISSSDKEDEQVDTEASQSNFDIADGEVKTEPLQPSDEVVANGDGEELKIESSEEDEIDSEAIIEKLNDEFDKEMGMDDIYDFEKFYTSNKRSRKLLNEFEMCSLNSGSDKGC